MLTSIARAEEPVTFPAQAGEPSVPLALGIKLNGRDLGLVAPFVLDRDGELWADRANLIQLRIDLAGVSENSRIALRDVPGLSYEYDETQQTVSLRIAPGNLLARTLDAARKDNSGEVPVAEASGSALLNYSVFATGSRSGAGTFAGISGALDGRLFTHGGEFRISGLINPTDNSIARRLDTTWTRILPSRDIVVAVGDSISSVATWGRPIRFAGVKIAHNYTLRPDLVTIPLPGVSGVATVPSALDVYIDGARQMSATVGAGPFSIRNLPGVTGTGQVRAVLRDVQGRESETITSYFVSNSLLRTGLVEYAFEAGVPRLNFGNRSTDYVLSPFVSVTARGGVTDALTIETHGEVARDLAMVSAGAAFRTYNFGVLSFAVAGSRDHDRTGGALFVAFDGQWQSLRFLGEMRRTLGTFRDLAASTARTGRTSLTGSQRLRNNVDVPRSLQRISVSLPFEIARTSLAVSYVREDAANEDRFGSVGVSMNSGLFRNASLSLSGFVETTSRGRGIFASLSLPLSRRAYVSAGLSDGPGQAPGATIEVASNAPRGFGAFGWRASVEQRDTTIMRGAIDYQSGFATLRGQIAGDGRTQYASLGIEGALVWADSMFAAPRIDAGFAVVDAGAAGIPILFENRLAGKTNRNGRLLLTEVRPFQSNQVSIDVGTLPDNFMLSQPVQSFRPMTLGGVRVPINFTQSNESVLLHLVDNQGRDLPVGSTIRLSGETAVVIGFDGLALIARRQSTGGIEVETPTGICHFDVLLPSSIKFGTIIGPLVCE